MNLYNAAKEQNYDTIKNIKSNYYINTGLYGACEIGDISLVKYFIQKEGAWNINIGLYYACIKSKNPNKETIEYLLTFNDIKIIPDVIINCRKYAEVENYLKNNKYIR